MLTTNIFTRETFVAVASWTTTVILDLGKLPGPLHLKNLYREYILPAHITPTRHSLRRDYTLGTPGVFLNERTSFLPFSPTALYFPVPHLRKEYFQQARSFFCLRYQPTTFVRYTHKPLPAYGLLHITFSSHNRCKEAYCTIV